MKIWYVSFDTKFHIFQNSFIINGFSGYGDASVTWTDPWLFCGSNDRVAFARR